MPESRSRKRDIKKNKSTDEEIVRALRKAVLNEIEGLKEEKQAVQKITSNHLTRDLKNIGENLLKRQATASKQRSAKKANVSLTKEELQAIKKIPAIVKAIDEKSTKLRRTARAKQAVTKQKTQIAKRIEKKSEAREVTSENLLRGGSPSPKEKLLVPPSFWERLSSLYRLSRVLTFGLIIFIVLVLFIGSFLFVIYRTDWNNAFFNRVVSLLHLPAATVNGSFLSYAEFKDDVAVLESFFNSEEALQSGIPQDAYVKKTVLERQIRRQLVSDALIEFGQELTDEDINKQLEEVTRASGGKEELKNILENLYSWSVPEFIEKALRPLLEEERLSIYISQNPELNRVKERRIYTVKEELDEGGEFAELAKQYSDDSTAPSGGDLDWFTKGDMVQEFENEITKLDVGETSDPFRTIYGWHIVNLTDKNDENETFRASHILIQYLTLDEFLEMKLQESTIRIFINV